MGSESEAETIYDFILSVYKENIDWAFNVTCINDWPA